MKLNHSVSIRRPTASTRNERGEPTVSGYTTVASAVRASIQPLTARELAQLGQGGPVASTHKIYLYPRAVVSGDQVVEGSTTYEIDDVLDQAGAHHHLRLDVHAVAV